MGDAEIGPKRRGEALSEEVSSLVDRFGEESKVILKQGLDNVTCESTKCVFAPVKNSLCAHLLGGMALWIISTVPMIIGLFVMEISICYRRLQLADPIIIKITAEAKEIKPEDEASFSERGAPAEIQNPPISGQTTFEKPRETRNEPAPESQRIPRRPPSVSSAQVPETSVIPDPVPLVSNLQPKSELDDLVSVLRTIRNTKVVDSALQQKIREFDAGCLSLFDRTQSLDPDPLEPSRNRLKFAFPERKSARRGRGFDSSDSESSSGSEDSDDEGIWHSRPYVDSDIGGDASCSALGRDVAAYVGDSDGVRAVRICPYRSTRTWTSYPIESKGQELAVTLSAAWILSQDNMRRVPLNKWDSFASFDLDARGLGKIALYDNGIAVVFDESGTIFTIKEKSKPNRLPTSYDGFTCLSSCGQNILVGVRESGTAHMFSSDGREVRCFAGHCAPITLIEKMSDNLLATRGDDTIRIWDVRSQDPFTTVLLPEMWVTTMAGSEPFLAFGCDKRRIGCMDVRRPPGKAILGVKCGEYEPRLMKLNEDGSLAMFARIGRASNATRRFNVRSESIFRVYSKFIPKGG
jgi:hypothetical protein